LVEARLTVRKLGFFYSFEANYQTMPFIKPSRILIAALCILHFGTAMAQQKDPLVGTAFPQFNLGDLESDTANNATISKKFILFCFWSPKNGPSIREREQLNNLVGQYDADSVWFLAPTAATRLESEVFLKTGEWTFRVMPDASTLIAQLKIKQFPTYVLVDFKGNIRQVIRGTKPDLFHYLMSAIDKQYGLAQGFKY